MGDGILAFFENPPDGVTSAQASVKAAMAMKVRADLLDKKYKDELKNFAFNKMKNENIDVLLMGHYHEIGIYKNNNKQFIHLGDWINQHTVTTLDKNGVWNQKKW